MKGELVGMPPGALDSFLSAYKGYTNPVEEIGGEELPWWVSKKTKRGLHNWKHGVDKGGGSGKIGGKGG